MSNHVPMLQPLIPLDVIQWQFCAGPAPENFCFFEFTTTADKHTLRFIPSGSIELLLPLTPNKALFLIGASKTLHTVSLPPDSHYLGIRFAPGVFYWPHYHLPAAVAEKNIAYSNPEDYSPIMPQNLTRFESLEKKASYVYDNILPCLRKAYLLPVVSNMVGRIEAAGGNVRVEDLAAEYSYSTRHINRMFMDALGYGPKDYCKYVRFQSVLAEIERMPGRNNSAFIQKAGYSDQAHFQREFKTFTGITPKQYIRLRACTE